MDAVEAGRTETLSDKSVAVASPATVSNSEPETKPKAETDSAGLGSFLTEARERRGVSIEEAIRETRIPDHYVRMMERNDYSMISDQLYVMPFLRRYAEFLKLDPEAIAMRFVREVQRADNLQPSRSIEPIEMNKPRPLPKARGGWRRPVVAAAVIVGLLLIWLVGARHYRSADIHAAGSVSDQSASTR
jgi:cytoskeletal protein RodZ